MPTSTQEQVANAEAIINRVADPNMVVTPVTPADFSAQYPQPLDPTELLAMCSEVRVYNAIPEYPTGLKFEFWREMNRLAFGSGTMHAYAGFRDGECPTVYEHSGNNFTAELKNVGVYKALTLSDIRHSQAVAGGTQGLGINRLAGAPQVGFGQPGGGTQDGINATVADLKAKEMVLGGALVLNALDYLMVKGNKNTNPLVFDGIETIVTAGNGAHANTNTASGTFTASAYNLFLGEACTPPDKLFAHQEALQAVANSYFTQGFQGSQLIQHDSGNRIVPGFNFASQINTAIGTLTMVGDNNFTRTSIGGGGVQTNLYALKTTLNGEELVYRRSQFPLGWQDLAPGCTAVQFLMWTKTVLIIKHMCAQNVYTTQYTGNITTTCPFVGT